MVKTNFWFFLVPGRTGVLQCMESQRVSHGIETEQKWVPGSHENDLFSLCLSLSYCLVVVADENYPISLYLSFLILLTLKLFFSLYFIHHSGKLDMFIQIRSDQISHSVVSNSLRPHESQHTRPPCPPPTPGVHPDSCPSSQWCHPAISSSVVPFSSCPQSLPASESCPMSQLFTWCGQSTGASASAAFLPKKFQGWSPTEWTGWISLQSKGLSRIFSNITVQKHQFFGAQPSS